MLHIAGTGSDRLWPLLRDAVGADECAVVDEVGDLPGAQTGEQFRDRSEADRARIRLVVTSLPFGLHRSLPRAAAYVALLRDPLERVLAVHEATALRLPADRSTVSLEDFVVRQHRLEVDNGQVRAIAGRRLVRWGATDASLLSEAMANVQRRFAAVLVESEPALSAAALERVLGRPLEGAADALAAPAHELPPCEPRLAERIRSMNDLDARLLQAAVSRLRAGQGAAALRS